MSGQNSIIEHRASYFFLKLEEDYLELFSGKKYQHCKAAILSILEGWMNKKRFEGCKHDDLFVYMSYPQFVNKMFGLFGRSTVIRSLDELIAEKIVISRAYVDAFNQSTFEYRLDIEALNAKLRALPEKPAGNVKVNGGSVKINDPHVKEDDGPSKNTRGGSVKVNDGSCKSKRNVDTNIEHSNIDTNREDTFTDTETQPEPIATSHEVAAHPLFSQEADTQASLIAVAKSEGLQEASKQEEGEPSKSSSSQGKRRPAKPVDETLKVRVERVYGYFDTLAQETSGDATYRYQRTKKATAAITEWLKGTPTEELLREVYLELWNTPADIRSGFEWKSNMQIHSVLAQYDSRALAIKAKRHAAQPKPATVAQRPARHVEDDDEPLQYRPPLSQRNKNNRPFQAIAAARRV